MIDFSMKKPAQFDHEKLEVYQLELQFIVWLVDLLDDLADVKGRRIAETLDQLDRASQSTLLNTAEGNGRRASQQRVRFFDDARGSATECAACLDVLVAKKAAAPGRMDAGKSLLVRIVSILSKLIERFEENLANDGNAKFPRTSSRTRTRTI